MESITKTERECGLMKHAREPYASLGGGLNEHNDCVVRAFSLAGNLPYTRVHAVLAKHGRKRRGHTEYHVSITAQEELFPHTKFRSTAQIAYGGTYNIIQSPTTVAFTKAHPVGRYICFTRTHAFALIDGVVHDWKSCPRARVKMYCQVSIGKQQSKRSLLQPQADTRILKLL